MFLPTATYRIQLTHHFGFKALAGIIPYVAELGISAIYASPILKAVPGSEHGYDGIDPTELHPGIGDLEQFRALSALLKERNMGWIQDIVPNHMAFDSRNKWLADVLERGQDSTYSRYFDIDWHHPDAKGKLMAPLLEDELEQVLLDKKIFLSFGESGFYFKYYDQEYPLNARSKAKLADLFYRENQNRDSNALVAAVNADHNCLMSLFDMQYYTLTAHWEAGERINYRRFFNINGMIALRMEDEQVFQDYHRFLHQLYEEGLIQGLRIDHIDGLYDPQEYLVRLRDLFGADCYIIVEKVLERKEHLPTCFPVEGTSGYEFLSYINQLLTDTDAAGSILENYNRLVPEHSDYDQLVYDKKAWVLMDLFSGELDNIYRAFIDVLPAAESIEEDRMKKAIVAFLAAFPVYRIFVDRLPLSTEAMRYLEAAFSVALHREPMMEPGMKLLRQLFQPQKDADSEKQMIHFIARLMQLSGPLAAKGVEDTVFYVYNPLVSHNEVGDSPCLLGISAEEFHSKMLMRCESNRFSMNSTATHDTKRGEDARLRINVLSELADEWIIRLDEWLTLEESKEITVNDAIFFFQSLVGSFPVYGNWNEDYIDRTKAFFVKAIREGKENSNYRFPNRAYEMACLNFADKLLSAEHPFMTSFLPFVKRIERYAARYSLVQTVVKIAAPGIPDIYRGNELPDHSYVDPDNRRKIDFDDRKHLANIPDNSWEEYHSSVSKITSRYSEAALQKFFTTRTLLRFRKQFPELFTEGNYLPLMSPETEGKLLTFLRVFEEKWLLVILPLGIVAGVDPSLRLPAHPYSTLGCMELFTGIHYPSTDMEIKPLFDRFPVAVLVAV